MYSFRLQIPIVNTADGVVWQVPDLCQPPGKTQLTNILGPIMVDRAIYIGLICASFIVLMIALSVCYIKRWLCFAVSFDALSV